MAWYKSGTPGKRLSSLPAILIVQVAVKLLIHLLTAANYGLLGDELYFLAWGSVGQPPLVAGPAWLARAFFGTPVFGVRVIPARAGAGLTRAGPGRSLGSKM